MIRQFLRQDFLRSNKKEMKQILKRCYENENIMTIKLPHKVLPGYNPVALWSPFCWPRLPAPQISSNMPPKYGKKWLPNMVKTTVHLANYGQICGANKYGKIRPNGQDTSLCNKDKLKVMFWFPHRISPNIKDWFRCSNHPTHKSTNGYANPDGGHEEGVNGDDNSLIMTNTGK